MKTIRLSDTQVKAYEEMSGARLDEAKLHISEKALTRLYVNVSSKA